MSALTKAAAPGTAPSSGSTSLATRATRITTRMPKTAAGKRTATAFSPKRRVVSAAE
jgi:hypothetical protein